MVKAKGVDILCLLIPLLACIKASKSSFISHIPYNASKEVVFTKLNRCMFYPRCLLFACCDLILLKNIQRYHNSLLREENQYEQFPCMTNSSNKPGVCSHLNNVFIDHFTRLFGWY